jgi:uncharacterized protein
VGLREIFFPKKRDFIGMMAAHARKNEEGVAALEEFMKNPTPENEKRVEDLELATDELRTHLVNELHDSFITPIDREDIFKLSRAVDDMVDYAKTTVEEMMLFKIAPNPYLLKMAAALTHEARDIADAITVMKENPKEALEKLTRAKKAENFIEHRYREALAELFESDDLKMILKMRELYRHISNAADRGDEAANILSDIIVKTG